VSSGRASFEITILSAELLKLRAFGGLPARVHERWKELPLTGAQGDRREENGREHHRLKALQSRPLGG